MTQITGLTDEDIRTDWLTGSTGAEADDDATDPGDASDDDATDPGDASDDDATDADDDATDA